LEEAMSIGDPKANRQKTKRATAQAVNVRKTKVGPDKALFAQGGPIMAKKPNPFAKKAAGAMPGDGAPKKMPPWLQGGKAAAPAKKPAFKSGGMVCRGMGAAKKGG
jgi:hypothetical protein